ncbi:hypothetical protein N7466_010374 [Penicillium verhagenii]|uniref:uncharacterized protein n=1 Tax=Penicillium verhagenii TaxID=1562060 RepID=UPI002545240F|nr:uncharacterized protein N7466_010374 [Penicillium verhagenii]KAJ5919431.1 hypothetical protein N7466_010374 [Penicillium verhagenii]
MGIEDLIERSTPQTHPAVEHDALFSGQPATFILPTHMTLEELHQSEDRLLKHGGNLTYDIAEAALILGRVDHKKRAMLELRSRGIWTEENTAIAKAKPNLPEVAVEPALKRQKNTRGKFSVCAVTEIVDLCNESDEEKGSSKTSQHVAPAVDDSAWRIEVIKLDWLDRSIEAGESLPRDSFLVYRGWKQSSAPSAILAATPALIPKQIIQRAREDGTSWRCPVPPPAEPFHGRRSNWSTGDDSSQRNPPVLYRQSTSEHDETITLPPQPEWVRDQVLYACMRSAPLRPPNEDFIAQLVNIRRIRELTLDEIGVRAYSTSIAAVAAYPYRIKRPSEVIALPGCDAKIANLFAEFQHHGTCGHSDEDGNVAAADALENDPALRVLDTFNKIWGVGAKTARDFYYHRGWRDLDDIVEHGWSSLSRVQQIGVKFFEEFQEGVSRAESESIAAIIRRHANEVRPEADGGVNLILVGGYRRGKERSGDVDVILTHRENEITRGLIIDIVASLEKEKYITHTLSLHLTSTLRGQQTLPFRGDETGKHFDTLDKALVVWQDPDFDLQHPLGNEEASGKNRNPNPHHRVDIIISPWRTIGCAILGWTGGTTFQRDLRRYAKTAHDWKFDSSGIRERTSGGQVVDLEQGGETWEAREKLVMERLGIGWRPPQERCSR